MDILDHAQEIKKQADKLLQDAKIVETLKDFGEIQFAGSYSLNLMVNRDIDLYVINEKYTKEDVLKALNSFIHQEFFNGYLYYDFTNFKREGFPKGDYIGLKTRVNNVKWKIDIWFLNQDLPKRKELINSMQKLSNEQKKLILELKHYIKERDLDIPSTVVYENILTNKIHNIGDFIKLIDKE